MTAQVQTRQDNNIVLSEIETNGIEKVFSEAKDFRSIGEIITAPIDSIISETAKVIDSDPIMNVSGELEKMNGEVQGVYKEIMNNDGTIMKVLKSVPLLGNLAEMIDGKVDEAKFNMKSLEGKIGVIFSGFDQSYSSINTSIDMQKKFVDGIDANLDKISAYKNFIDIKIAGFKTRLEETTDENEKQKLSMFIRNVEYFQSNLVVLIGNLDMARKRLLMRLDSATKLSLAMNSSRPIFKTLLSTALIETSSQKAIDASMKAMDIMGSTIDKMSSELTDKAIESNRKSEEMTSKSVLSTKVFEGNVIKLKKHFDEIETYRESIKQEAELDKQKFNETKEILQKIKVVDKDAQEELAKELNK